ncbi:MAG: SPASM domain-containing protein [Acetobacteraceae bacterium]|nr:SPASM domain-containing protein [Acetobacteraceae bacterium]
MVRLGVLPDNAQTTASATNASPLSGANRSLHGTVYPCAALHRSELALGNIGREPLAAIHERSRKTYGRLTIDDQEDCRDCDFRHFCAGGCRAITYAATGRFESRAPNCQAIQDRIINALTQMPV